MYARYVPKPKGGPSSTSTAQPTPPTQTNTNTTPANSFNYSRYVPSAKHAPQPEQAPKVQYFDDEPSSPNPKRKRDAVDEAGESESKKSKTAQSGLDTTKPEEDAPKKKKRVRRGKKRTGAADEADEYDSDTPVAKTEPPKAKEESQPDVAVEEKQDELKGKSGKSEKKKKDKKTKGDKNANKDETKDKMDETPDVAVEVPEPQDVQMVDAEPAHELSPVQNTPSEPIKTDTEKQEKKEKKEKKREKKKKQKEPVETPEETNDDEIKRHKAVLERKAKSLQLASEMVQDSDDDSDMGELHGLEPLPQPEPVSITTSKPTYETLPPWLSEPIRVKQDTRTPFTDLGILPKAARVLEEKGFRDAFAVQTAAIPLLLPTSKHRPGDVLVSAATGSGKTLAYSLPIVRDISQGLVTRLRALVVLPTRELVKQAQDAFELCAKAYEGGDRKRVRVGVSIGNQSLKSEQESLVDRETRYDPEAYNKLLEESRQKKQANGLVSVQDALDPDSDETDPRLSSMDGYVVDFTSRVDVLICTPGRLVEHIEQTPGFSLDYVRWLVVDEADKLLAQSFQGWLDLAMEHFRETKFSARDFPDVDFSGVRKVILSATLTRDLSLLSQLGLRRPRLIVLESDDDAQIAEHSLPVSLKEFAVRVHDTNLKPLYLLELLQGQHMLIGNSQDGSMPVAKDEADQDSGTSSDDSSDTSSDSDSDSDATSDTSSDSESDSDPSSDSKPAPASRSRKSNIPVSLIFTKSNESALRLSRLLTILDPSLASHIGTLTSTTPTHIRRKTLRSFMSPASNIRLLIASDLVARGIDLPNLDHVINYDLPPSVAGYVHRVGRTARAGQSGCAWTLVGDEESGWFWGKIAKGNSVKRAQKMERTRIEEMSEDKVQEYEVALEKLGKEAGR